MKRALKTQETYENFIRCLVLYNQEIVSKVELVQLVNPFLARFPEMFRWFKEFIGHNEEVSAAQASAKAPSPSQGPSYAEPSSSSTVHQERPAGELATEIGLLFECKLFNFFLILTLEKYLRLWF